MTVKLGLLVLLEAKAGKGVELGEFLKAGQALAEAETGTVTWYAFKITDTQYGIFDSFESEEARQAHLGGEIPTALGQVASQTCSPKNPTSASSMSSRSSSGACQPCRIPPPIDNPSKMRIAPQVGPSSSLDGRMPRRPWRSHVLGEDVHRPESDPPGPRRPPLPTLGIPRSATGHGRRGPDR